MTRQTKRKIIKALARGAVTLAGSAGAVLWSRKNKRQFIKKHSAGLATFAAFGGLMYLKGRILPKYADDYPYSYKWDPRYGNLVMGDQEYERNLTLRDLVDSQAAHYKTWDGRVLADFLVQLVLMSDDKKPFDIANTLIMLTQLLVCGSMGKGRPTGLFGLSFREVLTLTAGFWLCTPHLIATCFWLTGSVTYLWTGLIESLYVLPYAFHYHDSSFSIPAPGAALMGLAAGWSVEVGAGAALMLSGLELARSWYKKEAASWMIWGVLGICAGMTLLLAAPGNRIKFRLEKEMSDTLPENLEDRVPGYLPPEYTYTPLMFRTWFLEGFVPTILRELPLQIPVFLYFKNRDRQDPETTGYILGLEAAALAIPTVMMLSPEYPKRATYPAVLYLLPAALKAMDHLDIPSFREWDRRSRTWAGLAAGGIFINYLASLIVDADIRCQIRDQVLTLENERGKERIIMENVGVSRPFSLLAGNRSVTWDTVMGLGFEHPEDPYNKAAAAYYGADQIASKPLEIHRYYNNNPRDLLFSLIQPLKSFVRVIGEWIKGDRWPLSYRGELPHNEE